MERRVQRKILKNKPLIEAIFELRWRLQEPRPGIKVDPGFSVLIGRMYDRLHGEYPIHEKLAAAMIPDELTGYVVKHRFRKAEGQWPLVQLGPGIVTANDTEGYVWEDFTTRVEHVTDALFSAYPTAEGALDVSSVQLRYIDAIPFDFQRGDVFKFLREHMKTSVELYPMLFDSTSVERLPATFDMRFSFSVSQPRGSIHLRFVRGSLTDRPEKTDALIWETMVQTLEESAPRSKEDVAAWVKGAHDLTDDWFFKIIEGELLRRFE